MFVSLFSKNELVGVDPLLITDLDISILDIIMFSLSIYLWKYEYNVSNSHITVILLLLYEKRFFTFKSSPDTSYVLLIRVNMKSCFAFSKSHWVNAWSSLNTYLIDLFVDSNDFSCCCCYWNSGQHLFQIFIDNF